MKNLLFADQDIRSFLQKGNLVIMGGGLSAKNKAILNNLATYVASQDKAVAFFTVEEGKVSPNPTQIHIFYNENVDFTDISGKCNNLASNKGLSLVIIENVYNIKGNSVDVLVQLRELALRLNLPVVVVVQVDYEEGAPN